MRAGGPLGHCALRGLDDFILQIFRGPPGLFFSSFEIMGQLRSTARDALQQVHGNAMGFGLFPKFLSGTVFP